ncbi:sulfatase family protein, partial [Vibrio parahaemolyticus EKP-021]
AQ